MKYKIRKIIYVTLAFLFLAIASIGVVMPVLPTTPFLLLASFFFTRGSERFNNWFISTELYKNNLESFVRTRAMTFKTKAKILTLSTTLLLIAIYVMNNIYGKIIVLCVMICKYYYFIYKIETINKGVEGKYILRKELRINEEEKRK